MGGIEERVGIVNDEKVAASTEYLIDNRPVYRDFIRISNRDNFLASNPNYHPNDPRYRDYWSLEVRRCVEGKWGYQQEGGWRYMRGATYYYGNYVLLEETNPQKETYYIRPRIDDLEWELSYGLGVARGFSGFANDPLHTCLVTVLFHETTPNEKLLKRIRKDTPSAFKEDGTLKKYVDARIYIRQLHTKPLGRALYENPTQNFMIFGSRGGGKSYFVAGECEHALNFDGAVEFDARLINEQLKCNVIIGSANTNKSSELISKIRASMDAKANIKLSQQYGLGVTKVGSRIKPSPMYRDFDGSLSPNNKTNPWRHSYKVKQGGRWVNHGSGSQMGHINYSENKTDGAESGAGGRYLLSVIEEVGLTANAPEINQSNNSAVAREGVRFGTEIYLGTSGNILKVQGAKMMFLNPQDYNIMAFENHFGGEGRDGKIGFFIPFYMTLRQYKDEDGNTDYAEACRHVRRLRADAAASNDPEILRKEKMNRPCWVKEMWISMETDIMPIAELELREEQLMKSNHFRELEKPVELYWDPSQPNGVNYRILHDVEPFREYPIRKEKRKKPQGCIVIYEMPQYLTDEQGKKYIPDDMYLFGHDPYVQEDWEMGGSIGSTYVILNPKYATLGFSGNCIVASYNDKPAKGLNHYYQNQERLLAFYGNPTQGLCFEKNAGADCRGYYLKKNKVNLLKLSPNHAQGNSVFQKQIVSYGYTTSGSSKTQLARTIADWLLEATELHDGTRMNVFRIPDLFLIRQLKAYDLEGNFDAVDGFRGTVVNLRDRQIIEGSENVQLRAKTKAHLLNSYKKRLLQRR